MQPNQTNVAFEENYRERDFDFSESDAREGYEEWLDEIGYRNKLRAQAIKLQQVLEREQDEFYTVEQVEKALCGWLEIEVENLIEDAAETLPFHRAASASVFFGALQRKAA